MATITIERGQLERALGIGSAKCHPKTLARKIGSAIAKKFVNQDYKDIDLGGIAIDKKWDGNSIDIIFVKSDDPRSTEVLVELAAKRIQNFFEHPERYPDI